MKKILVIFLAIFAITLVSCNKEEVKNNTLPQNSINMINAENFVGGFLEDTILYSERGENALDADYFEYYFGNAGLLEGITDYFFYTSATTSVSEAGAFKVKNEETAKAMLEAFDTRRNNLISTYENYSPEDVAVAEKMEKGQNENLVWFVMTKDKDIVQTIIDLLTGKIHADTFDNSSDEK